MSSTPSLVTSGSTTLESTSTVTSSSSMEHKNNTKKKDTYKLLGNSMVFGNFGDNEREVIYLLQMFIVFLLLYASKNLRPMFRNCDLVYAILKLEGSVPVNAKKRRRRAVAHQVI